MSWINRLAVSSSLVMLSVCFAVLLVELSYPMFFSREADIYSADRRYMLFANQNGGPVFRNIDSFFTYVPNKTVNSATYYFAKHRWVKVYEYSFPTNNLGLVQSKNLDLATPTLLVLGDSFTEGQGAYPWFEDFSQELSKANRGIQPANGGILGTGFEQWLLLHNYLKEKGLPITKVVVVFISDDFTRFPAWNFPDSIPSCISSLSTCRGELGWYGMPPSEAERIDFLEILRLEKMERYSSLQKVKDRLKEFLPATSLAYRFVVETYKSVVESDSNGRWRYASSKAIEDFVNIYGDGVVFVHLPQKEEVQSGTISVPGLLARKEIAKRGAKLFDGFQRCGLIGTDYYEFDPHPNESGYRKIGKCVLEATTMLSH